MKFYRIDWRESDPTAQTTDWTTRKAHADAIARDTGGTITPVDVPTDKTGLLLFLRREIWCDAGRAIAQAGDR